MLSDDILLKSIYVRGEITSINYHRTGHVYLTLSDGESRLQGIIFRSVAQNIREVFHTGERIIAGGRIDFYEKGGSLSFQIYTIEKEGKGDLNAAFDALKKKLEKEGLFDPAHKQKIPAFPRHIGVVTSATGAAVQDILKILKNRTVLTDITVFPVQVQGLTAAPSMVAMLKKVDEHYYGKIDLLIVGRGGGSPEDLAAFNDEELARAIYACRIPIISAVGHEIDFSIADLAADVRAETPTAAATIAVKKDSDLLAQAKNNCETVRRVLDSRLIRETLRLEKAREAVSYARDRALDRKEKRMEKIYTAIRDNDPRRALKKGYALLWDADGHRVTDMASVREGDMFNLLLRGGRANAVLRDIQREMTEDEEDENEKS